jgi:hypothetical protein
MSCTATQRLDPNRTTPRAEIGESRANDAGLKYRKE